MGELFNGVVPGGQTAAVAGGFGASSAAGAAKFVFVVDEGGGRGVGVGGRVLFCGTAGRDVFGPFAVEVDEKVGFEGLRGGVTRRDVGAALHA